MIVDPVSSRLWVADTGNNRVLGWLNASGFTNGQPADVVLGQLDFTSNGANQSTTGFTVDPTAASLSDPEGLAVDSSGHLYVVDRVNNRVLQYAPPFTNGMAASIVIGNTDFTTALLASINGITNRLTAQSLFLPDSIAVDTVGNLFVVDTNNHRVVRYSAPLTTGMLADLVIGQSDFISDQIQQGGTVTARSLGFPRAVALDPTGNLYVGDEFNQRILQFVPPFGNNMAANRVLGNLDFFGNQGTDLVADISTPFGLAADAAGDLYVATGSRVAQFRPPFINGQTPFRGFGQANPASLEGLGLGQAGLTVPQGVAVDSEGRVFIADTDNNRVLAFD